MKRFGGRLPKALRRVYRKKKDKKRTIRFLFRGTHGGEEAKVFFHGNKTNFTLAKHGGSVHELSYRLSTSDKLRWWTKIRIEIEKNQGALQFMPLKSKKQLEGKICCQAKTIKCLACKVGLTVADFCGKPDNAKFCEGKIICCQAQTPKCLACKAGLTVADFCAKSDNAKFCESKPISTADGGAREAANKADAAHAPNPGSTSFLDEESTSFLEEDVVADPTVTNAAAEGHLSAAKKAIAEWYKKNPKYKKSAEWYKKHHNMRKGLQYYITLDPVNSTTLRWGALWNCQGRVAYGDKKGMQKHYLRHKDEHKECNLTRSGQLSMPGNYTIYIAKAPILKAGVRIKRVLASSENRTAKVGKKEGHYEAVGYGNSSGTGRFFVFNKDLWLREFKNPPAVHQHWNVLQTRNGLEQWRGYIKLRRKRFGTTRSFIWYGVKNESSSINDFRVGDFLKPAPHEKCLYDSCRTVRVSGAKDPRVNGDYEQAMTCKLLEKLTATGKREKSVDIWKVWKMAKNDSAVVWSGMQSKGLYGWGIRQGSDQIYYDVGSNSTKKPKYFHHVAWSAMVERNNPAPKVQCMVAGHVVTPKLKKELEKAKKAKKALAAAKKANNTHPSSSSEPGSSKDTGKGSSFLTNKDSSAVFLQQREKLQRSWNLKIPDLPWTRRRRTTRRRRATPEQHAERKEKHQPLPAASCPTGEWNPNTEQHCKVASQFLGLQLGGHGHSGKSLPFFIEEPTKGCFYNKAQNASFFSPGIPGMPGPKTKGLRFAWICAPTSLKEMISVVGVCRGGNRLAYPHRTGFVPVSDRFQTGFRPVSDQCQTTVSSPMRSPCHSPSSA